MSEIKSVASYTGIGSSFVSGAGILSIINLVLEISLGVYVINNINLIKASDANTKIQLGEMGKKIFEIEGKNNQVVSSIGEISKVIHSFKQAKNELVVGINELHQFKALTEERLDMIEQNIDLIIQAVEAKDIKVELPKPKPQSRFARKHMVVDEQKVSFKKPIAQHKTYDDEVDEDDEEAVLNAYRRGRK